MCFNLCFKNTLNQHVEAFKFISQARKNLGLGVEFAWNNDPYEYEFKKLAIDMINGTDKLRYWVQDGGSLKDLKKIEKEGLELFLDQRQECLLYT